MHTLGNDGGIVNLKLIPNLKLNVALISLLAFTACTEKKNSPDELNPLLKLSRNIVSTRAQNSEQFVAILKLKSPALLAAGQKQGGKLVINSELLDQVNKEQQEAIASLKALSDKVQIIYQYKMVLNGLAILAPKELSDKIKSVGLVAYSENSGTFARPKTMELSNSVAASSLSQRNSAKFIGAEKLNLQGITGKGIRVGIIDTGIDYTHAMLGGVGTAEAFKSVNPDQASEFFPNKKTVGGIDLVGTHYDAGSPDFVHRLPKPDMNPLDEAGHGSHVAGTVAGIGDGEKSYNGMAPDADLYAVKVFGKDGSTSDFVVIAALEYSADPNADGNNEDQLHVVNLSLGSSYGNPRILYTEAIKNLVNGGTVMVASAGNSGHKNYIVGAPGTSDAALSVAASVDNSDHLWKFNASRLNLPTGSVLVQAIEAATTKKIEELGDVRGELIYAGLAAEDFSPELTAAIKGKVALIDRGQVSFNDKIKRAVAAGAIGVVVANNKEGSAFSMGTSDDFAIPAIMISLPEANLVKEALKTVAVSIDFKTNEKIEKPELVDTLTDFTSKGPRSIDGAIKPEIAAPGDNIISAAMGAGGGIVQMSGTSMAAPHVAGVAALIKQIQSELPAEEIKSLLMGSAKTIGESGKDYSVSLQGAGRVRADVAAELKLISNISALSLGEVGVESKKVIRKQIQLKNLSDKKIEVKVVFEGSTFVTIPSQDVEIKASSTQPVSLSIALDASKMNEENIREMDGWVKFMEQGKEIYRIPVLAIAHKLSDVAAQSLVVQSTSAVDAKGAVAELELVNKNSNNAEVLLFNLISKDNRKPAPADFMTADCDLESAGYRIKKATEAGKSDLLQVAVKLYKPMTTWNACDMSMMIDSDGDGIAEQELLGSSLASIPGLGRDEFASTLIDARKARLIRKNYEQAVKEAQGDADKVAELKGTEDYVEALVAVRGLKVFNNSTIAVLEVELDKLAVTAQKVISFKLLVTHNEQSTVEFDDELKLDQNDVFKISVNEEDQSFINLPEQFTVKGGASIKVELTKGEGPENLMILIPTNRFSQSNLHGDSQLEILNPIFRVN